MSITATYVAAAPNSVLVAVSGAPSNASTVLIERSPDQVNWTTVRGTTPAQALSGGTYSINDYEFSDNVVNYYRATYFDTAAPGYAGTAAAATVTTSAGASASATPAMPSGLTTGDVVFVAIASTKSTATAPAAPTGWTALAGAPPDCLVLYSADWTASLSVPAFTVTGLASGDKVIGKAFGMRNVANQLANATAQVNTATTGTIAVPAFVSAGSAGPLVMLARSINTGVSPVVTTNDTATGYTLLMDMLNAGSYSAATFTLTGGVSATSSTVQVSMAARAFVSQETATVTPSLAGIAWFKDPVRPYLNRPIVVIGVDDVTHKSRSSTFDVIGRTMPIAVTDLFSGRSTAVTVRALDRPTTDDLENCLLVGDVCFLHAPKGAVAPTGYFATGDIARSRPAATGAVRYLKVPLTEVAAPDPSLAAVLSTWQTVISTYATWQALISAKATWNDVLQIVGTPSDVITG